jgi:hypothetical protein
VWAVRFGLIQLLQHPADGGKAGRRNAGRLRPAQRFEKQAFQFQGPAQFVIQNRGGLVCGHFSGAFDLFFGERHRNFETQRAGGGQDFHHQFAQKRLPARVGEQLVRRQNRPGLITGITGQDGSYLAELLLSKGYEVHGIIRRASTFNTSRLEHLYTDPHIKKAALKLHYGDLSDASALARLIGRVTPDEIYNLAAQSHVRVSFDSPEYTDRHHGHGRGAAAGSHS